VFEGLPKGGPFRIERRSAMSAIGTKRTYRVALHMSAFDPKRTWSFAVQMSANDPKRTSLDHLPSRWGHDHNRDKLRSVSCTGVLKSFQGTSITTESR
jgi:hypothetical protein